MSDAVDRLREERLNAGRRAAAYLENAIGSIRYELDAGRVPELPRKLVSAAVDVVVCVRELRAIGETAEILRPGGPVEG